MPALPLSDLLADCYRRLNYGTAPAPEVTARLTAFINETQDEILSQPSFQRMTRVRTPFTSEAGRPSYGIGGVAKIRDIVDPANQWRLRAIPLDQYRTYMPDPYVQLGTPTAYAIDQVSPVFQQPDFPSALFVAAPASSVGLPAVTVSMRVNLIIQGIGLYPTQTLNATLDDTIVPLWSPPNVVTVADWDLAAPVTTNRHLVLYQSQSAINYTVPGREIGRIQPGTVRNRSTLIYLAITPSAPLTYIVEGESQVRPLVAPGDLSILPDRFHRILADGARCREYEQRGDLARYAIAKRDYDRGLGFLTHSLSTDSDDVPVPNARQMRGPSVLGAWFPYSNYRAF